MISSLISSNSYISGRSFFQKGRTLKNQSFPSGINGFSIRNIWSKQRHFKNQQFGNIFRRSEFTTNSTQPLQNSKAVGWWLVGCSALVASTAVFGAYTRLSNAGLSMVKWRLVDDMFMPSTEEAWIESYEEYKRFPEYNMSSMDITLEQYKKIFFLEYFHRILGRITGAFFILPAAGFYFAGMLKGLEKRVLSYIVLVLLQGLMGWVMVKSGLNEQTMANSGEPGVSQYRLAAHLSLAFLLYSLTSWQAMRIFSKPIQFSSSSVVPALTGKHVMTAHMMVASVFLTAIIGAFVAGLDAGRIYNTYPKMEGYWIPPELTDMTPKWKNLFENPATVQFIHRLLAHLTLAGILGGSYKLLKVPNIPKKIKVAAAVLVGSGLLQIGDGIATILAKAHLHVALTHQLTGIELLTAALWLAFEVTRLKKGHFKLK